MMVIKDDHVITPERGSIRDHDGNPALGLSPLEFPLTAVCQHCGGTVRLEKFYFAEWEHSEG